jgi:hypothetical protein
VRPEVRDLLFELVGLVRTTSRVGLLARNLGAQRGDAGAFRSVGPLQVLDAADEGLISLDPVVWCDELRPQLRGRAEPDQQGGQRDQREAGDASSIDGSK